MFDHDWIYLPTFSIKKNPNERNLYRCSKCEMHWLSMTEPIKEGCTEKKNDKLVAVPNNEGKDCGHPGCVIKHVDNEGNRTYECASGCGCDKNGSGHEGPCH